MGSGAAAVWVIGGANVDVKARSMGAFLAGTSNPGSVHGAFGGVARNVAENLGRLGWRPRLVSAVGTDHDGEALLAHASVAGVDVSHVARVHGAATGRYVALIAGDGELVGAVADMSTVEGLELTGIPIADMRAGDVAVVDANLSAAACAGLLPACRCAGVTTFVDPVSAAKARRLAGSLAYVDVLAPNVDELAALLEDVADAPLAGRTALAGWSEMQPDCARGLIADGAARLCRAGCRAVVVTCGPLGACLVEGAAEARWFTAQKRAVLDVTGAGDALMAGVLHGYLGGCQTGDRNGRRGDVRAGSPDGERGRRTSGHLSGARLPSAMLYGMALAGLTVGVAVAVADTLTRESLEAARMEYIVERELFGE